MARCDGETTKEHIQTIRMDEITDIHSVPNLHQKVFNNNPFINRLREARITTFLKKSTLYDYDKRRWKGLDIGPTSPAHLFMIVCAIISAILHEFRYKDARDVLVLDDDSPLIRLKHSPERGPFQEYPNVMITGHGKIRNEPGFNFSPSQRNQNTLDLGLRNCVTPVEVRTYKSLKAKTLITQLTVYAHLCFLRQRNRHFVYVPVITEETVQLNVFDRAGLWQSSAFNIHTKAEEFVRLILGVSSPDCYSVGFNTSIYWKDDSRFIKTLDADKKPIEYRIKDPSGEPIFAHDGIEGRATCCWEVEGELVVKEQWSLVGSQPEWQFLKEVKGIPGLAQMVGYEDGQRLSARSRNIESYDEPRCERNFIDFTFGRITFQYGGMPLTHCPTFGDLLYAFRDAIAGHQRLFGLGILHRDISSNNFLVGKYGSEPGARGTLIDFDMAVKLDDPLRHKKSECKLGTRPFESLSILLNMGHYSTPRIHDHLDDLESFFYVLVWLTHCYEHPGVPCDARPERIELWMKETPKVTYENKLRYIMSEASVTEMNPQFQFAAFQNLFQEFRKFVLEQHVWKVSKNQPTSSTPLTTPDEHYATVLGFFDNAITEYNAYLPVLIELKHSGKSYGKKRRLDEDEDEDEVAEPSRQKAKKQRVKSEALSEESLRPEVSALPPDLAYPSSPEISREA